MSYVDGQSVYQVEFKLKKLNNLLVDDLYIEMELKNKQEESIGKYSTKLKVFSNTEGLSVLNSIESIERTGNGYTIKFYYSGMFMEGLMSEIIDNVVINKTNVTNNYEEKIDDIVNQINELRNLVLTKRGINQYTEVKESNEKTEEVLNQMIKRITSLEEHMKSYEGLGELIKSSIVNMDNRMNELDNQLKEVKLKEQQLGEITTQSNSDKGPSVDCVIEEKFNNFNKEVSKLKQDMSTTLIESQNKQQKIIEEITSLKNWSTQTDNLLFNINQTVNGLMASPSSKISRQTTEILQYGSEYTSEAGGSRGSSYRTPTLGSAPDSPRKTHTDKIGVVTSSGSKLEEEPKRKKLHQKKSISKTMKDLSTSGSFSSLSRHKTSNDIHGIVSPRGDNDRVISIIEETKKRKSTSSISSKSPRPKAVIVDKDNLKEEFEKKKIQNQKKEEGTQTKNDLIFKQIRDGEIMHMICNEDEDKERMAKEWIEENIKSIDFWENFDSQRPKGVFIICNKISEGKQMKKRLEMMFGKIKIGILGLEEMKEEGKEDGYIEITIQDNRVEDKEDKIKNLVKEWD
ncbi:hypothetical protein EHI_075170 [Entamoeba histolytica HM-1:IMSS]|uniref:Uncharacterized protein n=6 Tax=Entamoeba histolytica TaxID=5759 RepID=C4MA73_ENTH1|nr:hypothetical protein EHI_075170 [Entamoeba histolytica HM-1:IMSS]EAL43482.2 hypothetical protein EHI_075170 [Entamoeba histolytica HM-1:IMSS]EMD47523.1 Hypothetical protein EHI5A_069710 [Entamoeba histolytica KU27]ENY62433.1 hypothetical protein EHI7A_041580 [Entamoeba histolytica HM-1:IMSS-A]|eukprot:XP_648866.2 hypothetical protein EHI_075170 [Entamoeba histolytica HM-1:IMSS]